jgi:hypothetical protein
LTTPADPYTSLFRAAPEIINTPSLAVAAVQSPDPVAAGQALSHASAQDGVNQGLAQIPQDKHSGFFGSIGHFFSKDIVHPVEGAAVAGLNALGAPLREVQHQYRYLSDVSERHGMLASTLERLAMIGVGAGVTAFAGPEAGILAAEGTGSLLGRIAFRDSWNRTADGATYRDAHGHLVNPGFDLANLVDGVINGHDYTPNKNVDLPTGLVNAVFDLSLDPLIQAGKVSKLARLKKVSPFVQSASERALGKVGTVIPKGDQTIRDAAIQFGRPGAADIQVTGDRVAEIANTVPKVSRMMDILAGSSTEDVLNKFPQLAPLAGPIGRAATRDDVIGVFRDAVTAKNYSVFSQGMPTTALTRTPTRFKNLILNAGSKDAGTSSVDGGALEAPNKLVRTFTSYRPFNISDDAKTISGTQMNLGDDSSAKTLGQILRISQNKRTANRIVAQYINTPDIATRMNIYNASVRDAARIFGVPDDSPLLNKMFTDLHFVNGEGSMPIYGVNRDGKAIVLADEDGNVTNAGLLINQQGKVHIPDFNEMRTASRETRNLLMRTGGKIDDATEKYFTRWFKPLALLSLGFATRVAAGELVPASLRYGSDVVRGGMASAALHLNPNLLGDVAEQAIADGAGDGSLKGLRVAHDDHGVGRIMSHDTKTAQVQFPGEDTPQNLPLNDLTAYHRDIKDQTILAGAKEAGIDVKTAEIGHLRSAIGQSLYGVSKALYDPDYLRMAKWTMLNNNGHLVAGALTTGHGGMPLSGLGASEDTKNALASIGAKIPFGYGFGKNFQLFDGGHELHPAYWQFALKEAADDAAMAASARAYRDALAAGKSEAEASAAAVEADKAAMLRDPGYQNNMVIGHQSLDQYAVLRHDALQGLVYGKGSADGFYQLHQSALDGIADGAVPRMDELAKIPPDLRPMVKGRVVGPMGVEATVQKALNVGFAKVLDPIINFLSREPIYTTITTQEFKGLKSFVDAGVMSMPEANMIAQMRAVPQMAPLIHNTLLKSQFADLARNVVPFYFAEEQAYRRYVSALVSNPVGFEKARLAVHGIFGSGVLQNDGNGNGYVVFPGAGRIGELMTAGAGALGIGVQGGVPSAFSGSITSLRSVVPTGAMPSHGISPLVAFAGRQIESFFPASEPFLSEAMGPISQNGSLEDALIPNATLKRIIQATPLGERTRGFQSSFMYAIANAEHRAEVLRAQGKTAEADAIMPGPNANAHVRQVALDRIRNTTRIMFMLKASIGALSPLSPKMDVGDVGLRKELSDTIKAQGGDFALGVQAFLDKHPDATADTVFQSDSKYTGTSLPATADALQWVRDNRGFVNSKTLAAAYLIPQTKGAFDQEAYNLELAQGLRAHRTPQEMVDALYAASANAKFFPSLDQEKKALDAANGDPFTQQQIRQQFGDYVNQLSAANPVWAAQLNDPMKKATAFNALKELQEVFASGKVPASPQAESIRLLLASYDAYAKTEAQARSTQSSVQLSDLKNQWDEYLTGFVEQHPEAQGVVSGVFRRLPGYALQDQAANV